MGWYDTFRNTKINYYLIPFSLAVGPLIYLYIKSSVQLHYKFTLSQIFHFVPVAIYFLFKVFIYSYDSQQLGFDTTQNGELYNWVNHNLTIAITTLFAVHMLIYLVISFKLYYRFRDRLEQEYSNTYKYELRWLYMFLIAYTSMFTYDVLQSITDGFIFNLHWTQAWWYQFFSVIVVIYVGVMGYFTPLEDMIKLDLDKSLTTPEVYNTEDKETFEYENELEQIKDIVIKERLYIDSNLSLNQLSRKTKINTSQLSYIINKGLNKNFNDFINEYRVEEVKNELRNPEKQHLSILAIAYDSGFNSKATFNRVFKRLTGVSPSEYRK